MRTRFFASVILVLFGFGISSLPAETPDAPTPKHWAVLLPSTEVGAAIGDLLTVELSAETGFHLVDRADIHRVLKEIELAELFGEKSFEKRLQLGKILKADRLIVLDKADRIHILDTHYGLSLFNAPIDLKKANYEKTTMEVATHVKTVQRRFRDGIKTIVAIPYFVSKSFDRSFDYLQTDLPNLLSHSLQQDGIAVVAFDEVDKIVGEQTLTGGTSIKDRPVTIKIVGEITATMKTRQVDAEKPQLFSLRVVLKDGDKVLETFERKNLELSDLGSFLSTEVRQKIFDGISFGDSTTALDANAQKTQFLKDAASLDAVGAHELALRMREAAYLLDVDDLDNLVDILLGPCVSKTWLGFRPSPIKDRYRALPYLEQALKSKKLKLMNGLHLIFTVTKTTGRYPTYDQWGKEIPPPPFGDDPLNIADDFYFLYRLYPLLIQLPTVAPKEGPSAKRTDWFGIEVNPYLYGPAEQYRTVSEYLDHVFYDSRFVWNQSVVPVGQIEKKLAVHCDKAAFKAMFEMRSALPKESVLWKPGFLFYVPAKGSARFDNHFERSYQERLLQAIPREFWTYYCNLWRSTKDDDYTLLADLYELYWFAFNDGKNDAGDWQKLGVPKIKKIFEQRWAETKPGIFVPKDQKLATLLMYLRSLEIYKELVKAELTDNDPGTNLVYKLQVVSTSPEAVFKAKVEASVRKIEDYSEEYCYLRLSGTLFGKMDGGKYFHLKNDFFQFRPIPDWTVSLEKSHLFKNNGVLPFKAAVEADRKAYGTASKFFREMSGVHLGPSTFIRLGHWDENAFWHLEKLDDSTDILWTDWAIYRLSRNAEGKIDYHQLMSQADGNSNSKRKIFLSVQCNGNDLWHTLGTGRHFSTYAARENGHTLRLSDRDGNILCTFSLSEDFLINRAPAASDSTAQAGTGNQPNDGIVSIVPTSPGQCLVIGVHGPLLQSWIGKASFDASTGKKTFKLLYGATRNVIETDLPNLDKPEGLDVCFSPNWRSRFHDPQYPERNQVLVGRRFVHQGKTVHATPLLVDLDTEQVMLLTDRYPELDKLKNAQSVLCVNDALVLRRTDKTIEIYFRGDNGRYVYREISGVPKEDLEGGISRWNAWDYWRLFSVGNIVYAPGVTWVRIDLTDSKSPKYERLETDCTFPGFGKVRLFAPSALFGAWALPEHGDPYMLDPTPIVRDYSPFEGLVPEDRIARHDTAVKRLRELGVHIGHGNHNKWMFFQNDDYHEGMFAIFCNNSVRNYRWKGTPADLELLKDVYELRSVGFVDVDLGPEELKLIAGIPTICELALFRNGISDEDFALLPVENYSMLLLSEDHKTAKLTNQSLERLCGLENIKLLSFSGMGFTGAAYEIVQTLPDVRNVGCQYGSMSEETRKKIGRKKLSGDLRKKR